MEMNSLEAAEGQPVLRSVRKVNARRMKVAYHLPRRVMTAQLLPSLSVSFSTFVENDIALMMPSPNFSFNTALYAYP